MPAGTPPQIVKKVCQDTLKTSVVHQRHKLRCTIIVTSNRVEQDWEQIPGRRHDGRHVQPAVRALGERAHVWHVGLLRSKR